MNKKEIEKQVKEVIKEEDEKEKTFTNENDKPIPLNIAKNILDQYEIITLRDNEQMFFYNNGIYHRNSESKIKEEAQKKVNNIPKHYKKEVIELIKGVTYTDREEITKNKHLLHLKNGIYNLETEELEEFSPDKISITQLPVKYDPEANCPKIKKFMKEVVGEDQLPLTQELFGYCLMKDYKFNKAFMLFGTGRNGKTTFLNLLTKFLGEDSISIVSLQDLLYNRFAKQKLYGKLANLYDDLPNSRLTGTGNFKILTGKGRIWADVKFQDGFEFKNYAKLIFSCNELPKTEDTTYAFFRRWILIKFKNIFVGEDEDPNIEDKITTEEEMSGLFNWALEGLKRIKERQRFTETHTTTDLKNEWITRTDPLRAFVDKFVEVDSGSYITKSEFAQRLNEFCQDYNVAELTKQKIGQNLPAIIPQVDHKRIDRERCWSGIRFIGDSQESSKERQISNQNKKVLKDFEKNKKKEVNNDSYPTFSTSYKYRDNIYKEDSNILGYLSSCHDKILNLIPDDGINFDLLIDRIILEFDLDMKEDREKIEEYLNNMLKDGNKIFEPRSGFIKKLGGE